MAKLFKLYISEHLGGDLKLELKSHEYSLN